MNYYRLYQFITLYIPLLVAATLSYGGSSFVQFGEFQKQSIFMSASSESAVIIQSFNNVGKTSSVLPYKNYFSLCFCILSPIRCLETLTASLAGKRSCHCTLHIDTQAVSITIFFISYVKWTPIQSLYKSLQQFHLPPLPSLSLSPST